ncbi:MAG: hypothetical protein LBE81_09405 [Azonexus sp.]|jgi:hypothetical protein|uniref:hypothetical protein n=1 Tax=Azonexus sp. TaxID=1872668 RepID=UPI002820D8AF|nr:hypothetical protein [Azonexus sp.]MDR0776838.1 hypothetical protein [Azonexus sp.]
MKTLAVYGLLLGLLGITLSAQAVPNLELKELPPLKSLHYCQDSEGMVKAQNEECEFDKTEVSSIFTIRNGKKIHAPLGATLDTWNPDAKLGESAIRSNTHAATPVSTAEEVQLENFHHLIPHLLIGAILVAVIGFIRGHSGILGSIGSVVFCVLFGVFLNELLFFVSHNGNVGRIGVYVFLAIMFLRSLFR